MTASLAGAQAWLQREYPQVASGFLPAQEMEPALAALAERVYASLLRKCDASGRPVAEALEALVRMSVDFMRLQPRFMKTGRYASAGASSLFERFYGRGEVMEGYYLDGLLLTYAFWRNHARILRFFEDEFLAALPEDARLGEIGVGHGLMGLSALTRLTRARYDGLDLSPFALTYAEALFGANGVAAGRAALRCEDAQTGLPPGSGLDGAWCCEVIEHVTDPLPLLRGLRAALAPSGRGFVTTVANVEAEDHVYLFDDAAHVRRVLGEAGLAVEKEMALTLRGFEDARPLPQNYAAIVRRKESA
ncbi:MAG: class I SAM-dependent methyltransferase [Vicinamibacteria bacterium]